jgi:hypothetical protein
MTLPSALFCLSRLELVHVANQSIPISIVDGVVVWRLRAAMYIRGHSAGANHCNNIILNKLYSRGHEAAHAASAFFYMYESTWASWQGQLI